MSQHVLLALVAFAFVTSVTPGPNNLMLMASGANFGLRRTLPHMLGVALGFGAMVALLGLGIAQIITANPAIAQVMKWVSLTYVLWLAWKIAGSAAPQSDSAASTARPMSFLAACAFQWVNPKAWMMALGALSAYSAGAGGEFAVALVFTLVNLPSVAIWAAMGQGLRGVLQDPRRLRLFNWAMAGLLILSVLPVITGH
ncbi:LysE family translocator [Paracoccus litorisediminis]|jgi:threonine/homoserine/homoserine lactone efflux protein|uniref:LysE family translocator n=1 Tax=Paracoccus litorisediminis TaxID=2006130 RepID=A0A844HHQ1_9RHOB|nr:LysE family translocator [Paracoccus litorisediminis]MTH59593.1 LysE family translocator [Paracoccus litorisediminis]